MRGLFLFSLRKILYAISLAALLLFPLLIKYPAFADSVTIKGKRLAEISDIVSTATGSDFPEIQKHSLMLFERKTEGDEVVYQPRVFTVSRDGSLRKEYALDVQHHDAIHKSAKTLTSREDVVQKMDVAISPQRFGMRRNVVYTTAGLSFSNSYYSMTGFQTVHSSGTENNASMTTPKEENPQWYWGSRNIWGNAAMTIKGMEDKDVFILVHGKPLGTVRDLNFEYLVVDRNESGDLSSHLTDITITGGDKYFKDKYANFSGTIRGLSITAGDFDGDGYKNEVLMTFTCQTGIYAYIEKVLTGDRDVIYGAEMMPMTVIEGDTSIWGVDLSPQFSGIALAGDFDGDGVQEAAVVSKARDLTTGVIRVNVFKYNSGAWKRDWLDTIVSQNCTLKATRADLNGDGQDEIVMLVLDGITAPRLEFWGFWKGSIKPVRNAHCNKTLGFIARNDDYNLPYKTEEDFSLTAGPLLGTRGHAKLAEDIAISHVNSEGSAVYVVPTILNDKRNFTDFGDEKKIYEYRGTDSARRGGLVTGDFANETLMLGKPSHTLDDHDVSYITLLQALPYHVDNVDIQGNLTAQPINYTFSGFGDMADGIAGKMRVQYVRTTESSGSGSANFGLASTTENISVLDKAGPYVLGYLKFHAVQANIAGNFEPKAKPVAGALNTVMDLVTDKIDKTTTEATNSTETLTIKDGIDARQFDRLITYRSAQHIWRYSILNNPLPSWYILGPKADYVSGDFSSRDVVSKRRYITFSMYDNPVPGSTTSDTNGSYQARHEEGNFFSYPSLIEDIEGYAPGGALVSQPYSAMWTKSDTSKSISFEQTKIESQKYEETVHKSELSNVISAVASFFGADDPTGVPPYTSHSETFVKKYSKNEAINIEVYGRTTLPGEHAAHTLMAIPYVARENTMKVGTAVQLYNYGYQDSSALWRTGSRYGRYADPALVLPFKYVMMGAAFHAADQITASKVRGLRFYVPALKLDSDNNILGGLTYKISVPIYNASFRDTGEFEVRLSYTDSIDLSAPHTSGELHHIDTVKMSLNGWQNGSRLNKGWAEFTWNVPDKLDDGTYYFYIEIDPSHSLTEVHESRLDANDTLVDIGGNNEGYFRFNYTAPSTIVNKQNAKARGAFKAAAHSGNGTIFRTAYRRGDSEGRVGAASTVYDTTGTVNVNAKLDGEEKIEVPYLLPMLGEMPAVNSRDAIPVECEITYNGNEYYPEAYFYGVRYKPGTLDSVYGDSIVSDDAVSEYFMVESLPLVPGKTVKFTMSLHPDDVDWENGSGFELVVPELTTAKVVQSDGVGSTSGGCESGFTALGLGLLLAILRKKSQ